VIDLLCSTFEIRGTVRDAARRAWRRVRDLRYHAQTQVKASMLRAFVEAGIAESDFAGSSGYGYDDAARAAYESLLARVFGAERVLARLSIVSGTHAIVTTLAACVAPGATLLSASGKPYDTLRNAICDAEHALAKTQGIGYREVALRGDGAPDLDGIERESARRRIVHRQNDAGQDLDGQRDPGQDAEIPPIVQIARHRIAAADRPIGQPRQRQALIEPPHQRRFGFIMLRPGKAHLMLPQPI